MSEQYRRLTICAKRAQTVRSCHYVCFDCRKQFQKPSAAQDLIGLSGKPHARFVGFDSHQLAYPCPQCGHPLELIGKNFRAPSRDDVEGWEVARRLLNAGFGHWGHWAVEGRLPTRLKDVQPFIDQNRRKSAGERTLEKWGVQL